MQPQAQDHQLDVWGTAPGASPLPLTHPLALLVEAALTSAGLSDRQWIAVAPRELRELARPIRRARRDYRALTAPGAADIDAIRARTLAELSRLVADDQKRPGSPLWRVLVDRITAPPRPATGARDFKKVLAEAMEKNR